MKKFYLVFCILNVIWLQTGKALIDKDDQHPFHFVKEVREGNFEPFYLLSKSAYTLLSKSYIDHDHSGVKQPWQEIIDDAEKMALTA